MPRLGRAQPFSRRDARFHPERQQAAAAPFDPSTGFPWPVDERPEVSTYGSLAHQSFNAQDFVHGEWLSVEAGTADNEFDYFLSHVPLTTPPRPAVPLDETSDQAWLSVEADLSGSTEFDFYTDSPRVLPQRSDLDETSDQNWLSTEADLSGSNEFDFVSDAQRPALPQAFQTDWADVSWSPNALTVAFDATQIPWALVDAPQPLPPGPQQEAWFGWLASEAGGSGAVFDYFQPVIPATLPLLTNALDETSDQAWLSSEADLSASSEFDYFTDAQRANLPPSPQTDWTDTSWSPDSFAPAFDPTQEPWPLALDASLTAIPERQVPEGSVGEWLASEADLSGAVEFDYFQEPLRAIPPRPDLALDETSAQTWLASEAGGSTAVFDYWQEPPRALAQRLTSSEENIAPTWLGVEADLSGQAPFDFYTDSQRPNASQLPQTDWTDASWSPDAVAPPLDPTQEPWPLALDASLTAIPERQVPEGSVGEWLSSEADLSGSVEFDYWTDSPRAIPPRPDVPLDETSDQAWLASQAGPGDSVFDYFYEPQRGTVPRALSDEETVARGWLSSEADLSGLSDFGFYSDFLYPNLPQDPMAEGSDLPWSPDALIPPFDPTQVPVVFLDAPQPSFAYVAPEFWAGWLAREAGGAGSVFDYFQDPQRANAPLATSSLDEASDQNWLAVGADLSGLADFGFYSQGLPGQLWRHTPDTPDTSWNLAFQFDPALAPWPLWVSEDPLYLRVRSYQLEEAYSWPPPAVVTTLTHFIGEPTNPAGQQGKGTATALKGQGNSPSFGGGRTTTGYKGQPTPEGFTGQPT